jgi:hypothetical protein
MAIDFYLYFPTEEGRQVQQKPCAQRDSPRGAAVSIAEQLGGEYDGYERDV